MALRMRNATVFKAYATWEENAGEMKHLAAVAVKVLLRWQNQVASKMFMTWEEKWRESKRLRRVADKVFKQWTHSSLWKAPLVLSFFIAPIGASGTSAGS